MKYNADGSFAVTLVGQNDVPVGLYAPDGSTRVTQDAGFGIHAPNGALRIGSSGFSAYTLSGAMNGTLSGSSFIPISIQGGGVLPVPPEITLQSIGKSTKSGVRINPLVTLNPSATISGGDPSNHFAVSAGAITVTSAGDAADLSGGPYTLTISGDPIYTSVVVPVETSMNWYSVTSSAEMIAAVNDASLSAANKVEVLDGCYINRRANTDMTQTQAVCSIPARAFTGVVTDEIDTFSGNTLSIRNAIAAGGATARSSYTGGYCEITCRSQASAYIDQQMSLASGQRGLILSNLAYIGTSFVVMYVPTASAKFLPDLSTGYTGGAGYVTGETWSWTDGVDTIAGTLTATAGLITAATITTKTAGIEDKITAPVVLQNAASGSNGIHTAAGTGGTIVITHDNYAYGPPPGSPTYSLTNIINGFAQLTGSVTNSYPSGFNDVIIRDCVFGGYLTKPTKPNQWIQAIGPNALRLSRNVVVEDNQINGCRHGIAVGCGRHVDLRRNDIQNNYEDVSRFFEPTAYPTPSQMFTGGADDFANNGQQGTYNLYYNNFHNNLNEISLINLHADAAQFGTQANVFGSRIVVYDNRFVAPYGSTQGLYIDDAFSASLGIDVHAERNLIVVGPGQTSAIVAFRGRSAMPSRYINNTLVQSMSSTQQNVNNGAAIVRRGNGTGYVATDNIFGSFFNDSGYPYASTTITTAGTGYVATDKIVIQNGYGVFGYGTLNVSGGAITGVTWTVEPTGFSSASGLSTSGTSTLSAYPVTIDGATSRIYSDTGSGGVVKANAGALGTQYYYEDEGTINFGYGQNAGTIELTGNVSSLPYTANTGAGNTLPELFDGTFTRYDEGNGSTNMKGWVWAEPDHRPEFFRAAIDAIFTPKAGSLAVGKGYLVPASTLARSADSTTTTTDNTTLTADAA